MDSRRSADLSENQISNAVDAGWGAHRRAIVGLLLPERPLTRGSEDGSRGATGASSAVQARVPLQQVMPLGGWKSYTMVLR
jgi:hypothetical protein